MYRDRATWSAEERAAFWRVQAARYHQLAAIKTDAAMRVQFLQLSQNYAGLANRLNREAAAPATQLREGSKSEPEPSRLRIQGWST